MSATAIKQDTTRFDFGIGLYSFGELQTYVALSGRASDAYRTRDWLRVVGTPNHRIRRPDYSFNDLITLFVIRELRRKKFSIRVIGEAHQYLAAKWRTDRPFAHEEIKTDGVDVLCDDGWQPGQIESANRKGQQVMRIYVKDQLKSVAYDDGVAACWFPSDSVRVDPRIQFGDPVIDGTRLSTDVAYDVASVFGEAAAADRFNVSLDAIHSAMVFERRRRKALTQK